MLAMPSAWLAPGSESELAEEVFPIVELPVVRSGDVNRHRYANQAQLSGLIRELRPDVLDVHEEPFSVASWQWLAAAPPDLPVVMYAAQNIDKRYPPPFSVWERRAHRRVAALYPCSRQAASVARGKGYAGHIEVIPLGYDGDLFRPGRQSLRDDELVLALFGRLVPEKGIRAAVHVLARVNALRPARLVVVGSGPEERPSIELAAASGVRDRLEIEPWRAAEAVAAIYRRAHIVLVPSVATRKWTEQFGRVIVEAQASGAVVAGYASGSIPEVASDAGVLVDSRDSSALAEAVARLVTDPGEYERRRTRGFVLSRSRDWAHIAAQQAELYERVAAHATQRHALPRSPRARRALARAEFGSTAPTIVGLRPFAVPLLRRGGRIPSAIATGIDAAAELTARLPSRSERTTNPA
jgi:glycosyltransferase involved in cell wall biosynthesis